MSGILDRFAQSQIAENKDIVFKFLEADAHARFLDCGCHVGELTLELSRRIGTEQLYGIEIYEEFARQAEEKGIKVYRANLNEPLPVESGAFTVIHARNIIEHLYDTDTFIREIYRLLKPNGYAIISTPNLACLPNVFPLMLGMQPFHAHVSSEIQVGTPYGSLRNKKFETKSQSHLRIFTYKALKELFQYHGFSVERIISVGFYPLPASLGKLACRILPRHGTYLVIKARKL